MISRRTLQEIQLASFQPAEQRATTEGKRSKFSVGSWVSAAAAALSLLFFPGEALNADGTYLRFINVPFVVSDIQVPPWYKPAFESVYFGLLLLSIVFLFLARKYRKMDEMER